MYEGFRVVPAQLRAHANAVDDVATRATTAADAGRRVAGLDDAYGLICWPIGRMLAEPQGRCADALEKLARALSRIATDLDSSAESYARIDSAAETRLEQINTRRRQP